MREPLSLVARRKGSMLTVIARGELDAAGAPTLHEAVGDAVDLGVTDVVVDCRGLRFADAAGVRALLDIKERLDAEGGSLILFAPAEPVQRALELIGVEKSFFVVGE